MSVVTTNPLTAWIDAPATRQGIRFWRGDAWTLWTYEDLAEFARGVAGGLMALGVARDDRVLVVERTGPEFVAALYGTMLAGAVPCPVAPPQLFQSGSHYACHLQAIGDAARPVLVVTSEELVEQLDDGRLRVTTAAELAGRGEVADTAAAPASAALLQFTSGSSGRVKGVRVPVSALAANVAAIRDWTEMVEGDATASWLPVHHDMGLIGCLLTPVDQQRDLWLLEPADFVRDPVRYLSCFGTHGAVMTAMPPFGVDYITKRVSAEALTGSDFSGWRALILGAERIDVDVLDRFMALMGPFGFDRRAFLPAYGLAEATLAVTGLALREELTTVLVAPRLLSLGQPVRAEGAAIHPVVGCGRALDGVTVTVVDEAGAALPDQHIGQIVVGGTSVAKGYVDGTGKAGLTEWRDGLLWTGDAGFMDDGQLFVVGRLGDAMKVRGRTVFAEDIEAALVEAGVPRLRLAVLLGYSARGATAVVLLECPDDAWTAAARATVPRVTEHVSHVILDVPRRSIRRTTSGKPRRRDMWAAYVEGRIEGTEIHGHSTAPVTGAGE